MKKVALILGVATMLFGAEHKYELMPMMGYGYSNGSKVQDGSRLHDQQFFSLRLARNLNDFFDQIELGIDYAPKTKFKSINGVPVGYKTNVARYYLDFVKDMNIIGDLDLYWLVGAGYQNLSKEAYGVDSSMFVQAGVGLKYALNDAVAIKLEVRDALADRSNNAILTGLGFSMALGGDKAKRASEPIIEQKPAQITEPKAEPKPALEQKPEPKYEKVIKLQVNFDFDSDQIPASFQAKISEVASIMVQNPEYSVLLEGHTDWTGSEEYNQNLSLRRANAVASELQRLGVPAQKISASGFGELRPVADNSTKDGRAQNRRVEAKFSK